MSVEPQDSSDLGQVVAFRAAAGEANRVEIRPGLDGATIVTDRGAPLTPGPGCTAVSAAVARCAEGFTPLKLLVLAGDGADRVTARQAGLESTIDLGPGADSAIAGGTSTFVGGGAGNDRLESVGAVDQVLDGGAGADVLRSGTAGDFLEGGTGHDVLRGGRGDDNLSAEPGELDARSCGDGLDEVSYRALTVRPAPARCERVRLIDDQAEKTVVVTVATRPRRVQARSVLFDALRLEVGGDRTSRRLQLRSTTGAVWGRGVSSHTKVAKGYYSSPVRFVLTAAGRAAVRRGTPRLARLVGFGRRRTQFTVRLDR